MKEEKFVKEIQQASFDQQALIYAFIKGLETQKEISAYKPA